tara:strand:- start:6 stop:290 length:285 start_codon:yes stop_codon:yes gene_type:complete
MKKPKSKTSVLPVATQEQQIEPHIGIPSPIPPKEDVPETPKEDVPETPKEDVKVKKVRKPNPWIIKCQEVQARPENAGLSYREILKKAKLEYVK